MPARRSAPPAQAKQLTTVRQQVADVRSFIAQYRGQIQEALPRHLTPDRLIRVVMTEIGKQPKLLQCTQSSLIACVITTAQLGLEPGILGHAYLIPRKMNEVMTCTWMAGYLGLVQLARNSGEIGPITAEVVRDGDHFEYSKGLHEKLEHIPATGSGALTHAYAIARWKSDSNLCQWDVLDVDAIDRAKASSTRVTSGPWQTHEDEMWKKTALRRLCKYLPLSVTAARAVRLDEQGDAGLHQDFDVPALPEQAGEALGANGSNGDAEGGSTTDQPQGESTDEQ